MSLMRWSARPVKLVTAGMKSGSLMTKIRSSGSSVVLPRGIKVCCLRWMATMRMGMSANCRPNSVSGAWSRED